MHHREIALRAQDKFPALRVNHERDAHIHGEQRVACDERVREATGGVDVANVVAEPRDDPREREERLDAAAAEEGVEGGVEEVDHGEDEEAKGEDKGSEVGGHGVAEVGGGDGGEDRGRQGGRR